ncbi:MAG: 16S rRNA (cytosine(967)-C(5))-methyltransferase RsmB [Acidobacteriota bacterium]
MTAREVARRVLDRVAKGGAWATPTLDGELARAGLDDRDRRLAAELVYGVLRHRTRIDRALAAHADLARTPPRVLTALRVATYQLRMLDRVPAYAAVDDAVDAARELGGAKLAGFANALLRKIAAVAEPPLPPPGRERVELECSLPRWIVDELAEVAGDAQLAARAAAFAEPAPLVARVNRRRTTREALIELLQTAGVTARAVDGVPGALVLDGLGDPARSPSFMRGLWTVQDAGAQMVAIVAAPRAGQRILDACAGVGGKSTHLAELADDAVDIDAADRSTTKLGLLAETAQRLGLSRVRPIACDLLDAKAPLQPAYDLIVLDAPCSGLGVLRRHPDAKWRVQPSDVPRLAAVQEQLLDAIVPRLAPGGALVYSVCTFTRAEGALQVASLIARHPALRLVAEHRTWPPECDAFYLARLERS